MDREELESLYNERYNKVLIPLAKNLEPIIDKFIKDCPRIDRVSARAKSIDRFMEKAFRLDNNGGLKYTDPINQIQDQLGARIVTYYLSDVENVASMVKDYFSPIEEKLRVPESIREFGYEGKHFILFIPDDIKTTDIPKELCPTFFELQINTLFQHAWGEANHDLAYKPSQELTNDQKREIAFTAAQAWGADHIFNHLASELIPHSSLN
jgi:ppGpp synthetase/RelA/SpoT-type nucleotidyltranferase